MQFEDSKQADLASENLLRGFKRQAGQGGERDQKIPQRVRAMHQSAPLPSMPPTQVCSDRFMGTCPWQRQQGRKASLRPWEEEEKIKMQVAMDTSSEGGDTTQTMFLPLPGSFRS